MVVLHTKVSELIKAAVISSADVVFCCAEINIGRMQRMHGRKQLLHSSSNYSHALLKLDLLCKQLPKNSKS